MGKLAVYQTEAGPVRLSSKGKLAFDALCRTGGDIKLAAAYAQLTERQVRRVLAKPGMQGMMRPRARDILAKHEPMASERVVALMKQDVSRKVALEAAQRILDVGGVKPPAAGPTIKVGVGVQVGYVVNWEPDL